VATFIVEHASDKRSDAEREVLRNIYISVSTSGFHTI
jgi:hypothetical protein